MIRNNMTRPAPEKKSRRLLVASMRVCLFVAALSPAAALGQEEEVERDARLEGYATKVALDGDSTALTWILLVFLGAVTMGVMFKNAKRTHLD